MTIAEALQKARTILAENGIENPGLDSRILLAYVYDIEISRIVLMDEQTFHEEVSAKYFDLIEKRKNKYPVAYLTGEREFFSLDFKVNPEVLIPRPESEELIEWIIEQKVECERTLDLCTGSGCIGIALALNYPVSTLHLSDISEKALEITKYNAENLLSNKSELNWDVIQSDLMSNIHSHYNLIVTNPPYVLPDEYDNLMDDVRKFEPEIALLVNDYIQFFSDLLTQAYDRLFGGGSIFIETNPRMIEHTILIMKDLGFTSIQTHHDLSGKERFIKGQKPNN